MSIPNTGRRRIRPTNRGEMSPEMALRLTPLFGNSAEFWLNAQRAVELWDAGQAIENDIRGNKPLQAA